MGKNNKRFDNENQINNLSPEMHENLRKIVLDRLHNFIAEKEDNRLEIKKLVNELNVAKYYSKLSRLFQILGIASTFSTLYYGSGSKASDWIYVLGFGVPITIGSSILNYIKCKQKKSYKERLINYIKQRTKDNPEKNTTLENISHDNLAPYVDSILTPKVVISDVAEDVFEKFADNYSIGM